MNYHNITKDDMLNGTGLRVVLWVAGCNHNCPECHNPETHDATSGIRFEEDAMTELLVELEEPYIEGITFSGGDPLYPENREQIEIIAKYIKSEYPHKNVWLYTGYLFEQVKDLELMKYIDVLVDGPFIKDLKDENIHWRGSKNQRIIDVQKSLSGEIVLLEV